VECETALPEKWTGGVHNQRVMSRTLDGSGPLLYGFNKIPHVEAFECKRVRGCNLKNPPVEAIAFEPPVVQQTCSEGHLYQRGTHTNCGNVGRAVAAVRVESRTNSDFGTGFLPADGEYYRQGIFDIVRLDRRHGAGCMKVPIRDGHFESLAELRSV
jgi:hypothetical protein